MMEVVLGILSVVLTAIAFNQIDRKKFIIKKFVGPINQEIVNEIKLIIK